MTQQFDEFGNPLKGGQLYLIQSGTVSTPQNGFQDPALTIALPNPVILDAAGRVPQFFLADGLIKVRLQSASGVVQLSADFIQVIGPSSGGGGGGASVDPTTLLVTGMILITYGLTAPLGFVRCNGRTIGPAGSSASERVHADCQPLYNMLWLADATLRPAGSLGTATADWGAAKLVTLPDWRGRALAGLDGMGNSPASILTLGNFGTDPTLLGAAGGTETRALVTGNLPAYTPSGSITNGAIHSTFTATSGQAVFNSTAGGGAGVFGGGIAIQASSGTVSSSQDASTFTGSAQGGTSAPFVVTQPTRLATICIKL